jgi:O-antigen ligase
VKTQPGGRDDSAVAVTIAGRALRLAAGGALAVCLIVSLATPGFPGICKALALVIVATTVWQPRWGLVLTTALAPAGALLAAAPARAAELFAWALVAGWLLSVWRPLSPAGWPRNTMMPLGLYAGALVASWLALTIGGAAGIPPTALPQFIARAIPPDFLAVSSPEAETWTLLYSLAGIAVFIAGVGIARSDRRTLRSVGLGIVASMTILAALTLVDVGRQWAEAGYAADFLLRYLQGERFSLALADVNAAGSLYALAAVIALGYAWLQPARRFVWLPALMILAAAIWFSGSRSAYLASAAGAAAFAAVQRHWQPTRRHVVLAALLFLVAMLAAGIVVDPQSQADGSAGQSANLRSQFLLTSARMLASAPVFGVGVGRYWGRSAEFMTPELRDLYGNENAHNYFAQQFAELGFVGGVLFVWLVAIVLWQGLRAVLQSRGDIALQALFAGTAAYVLTCVTGHPLLVPEAALPFWAAFGAVAAASSRASESGIALSTPLRLLGVAAGVLLAAGVGRAGLAYTRATDMPPEQGFHQFETRRDGSQFRWMTRHAVMYIPNRPGFLQLRVRRPGWPAPGPVIVETSIGGRVVDTHEVPPDESTTWEVPARATASAGFRRVDFRVNQEWFEDVRLGRRPARRPVSVIVERIEWMPLR